MSGTIGAPLQLQQAKGGAFQFLTIKIDLV
jgi:hypothetical protein